MTSPASASRDLPAPRRAPGWSKAQRTLFLRAATAAGWNDQQRYVNMRAAGCALDAAKGRPTVAHPRNGQREFESVMALAESAAVERGAAVPRSREGVTWREVSLRSHARLAGLARVICAEARERLPEKFDAGLLEAASRRVLGDAAVAEAQARMSTVHSQLSTVAQRDVADGLDTGQLITLVECLKGWVGREFCARGMRPVRFDLHRAPGTDRRAPVESQDSGLTPQDSPHGSDHPHHPQPLPEDPRPAA